MNDLQYLEFPPQLAQILARTEELKFTMASEPRTGALLRVLAASKPAGRMLELGTGTGVATAWLLAGMDAQSTLVSVDVHASVQQVARDALGNDPRLSIQTEDAAALVRRQPPHSFDLVFADAMAGKYEALDEALAVVKPGGYYIIDDMLPQPSWPDGHADKVPLLMAKLSAKAEFQIVPMAWASGVVIAVKKAAAQ